MNFYWITGLLLSFVSGIGMAYFYVSKKEKNHLLQKIKAFEWEQFQSQTTVNELIASAKKSENRFLHFYNNVPEAIVITRLGRILLVNQACRKLIGLQESENLLGISLLDYVDISSRFDISDLIRRSAMGEILPPTMEAEVLRKDGHKFPVTVNIVPIELFDGPAVATFVYDNSRRNRNTEVLQAIFAGTAADTGDQFFQSAVRHLAKALQVRFAFVGQLSENASNIKTLAIWAGTQYVSNFTFAIKNTPHEIVISNKLHFYSEEIQHKFTNDLLLSELEAESYLGVPLLSKQGQPLGILAVLHDTKMQMTKENEAILTTFATRVSSELVRLYTEEKLANSQSNLQTVVSNTPMILYALDPKGVITLSEGKGLEAFGLKPGQQIGKSVFDLYKENERIIGVMRRALAGETFNSSGEIGGMFFESHHHPVFDSNKNVTGVIGVTMDVSERALSQKAFTESEERYRKLVELSPDAIFIVAEGKILFANKAGGLLFYANSSQDLVGWPILDIVHPEDRDIIRPKMQALENDHQDIPLLEIRLQRADESVIEVEWRASPFYFKDKKAIQLVLHDITSLKKAAAEILELNAKLEQRVRERTTQLEASIHELEAFSYTISHDLRAPLRAMNGYAEILLEDSELNLPTEASRYLRSIHTNSSLMGELIDDLLRFAQLNRLSINKKTIDLKKMLPQIVSEMRENFPQWQTKIIVEDLPSCEADATLLKQVFANLISNALKFTHTKPKAKITIGVLKNDEATVYYVKDEGVGFDMQYVHKMFGVFQRLHRADQFEGTGVGLAIVERIVKRHGGRVWAESKLNQGASFYFTL